MGLSQMTGFASLHYTAHILGNSAPGNIVGENWGGVRRLYFVYVISYRLILVILLEGRRRKRERGGKKVITLLGKRGITLLGHVVGNGRGGLSLNVKFLFGKPGTT